MPRLAWPVLAVVLASTATAGAQTGDCTVPDVVGLSPADAGARLAEAGCGTQVAYTEPAAAGEVVVAMSPPAGVHHREGARIVLRPGAAEEIAGCPAPASGFRVHRGARIVVDEVAAPGDEADPEATAMVACLLGDGRRAVVGETRIQGSSSERSEVVASAGALLAMRHTDVASGPDQPDPSSHEYFTVVDVRDPQRRVRATGFYVAAVEDTGAERFAWIERSSGPRARIVAATRAGTVRVLARGRRARALRSLGRRRLSFVLDGRRRVVRVP